MKQNRIKIIFSLCTFLIALLFVCLYANQSYADCEITNSKGKVVYSCKGPGKCSDTSWGHTLTCDAKKVGEETETKEVAEVEEDN